MRFRLYKFLFLGYLMISCSDQEKLDMDAFNEDRVIANYLLQQNLNPESIEEGLFILSSGSSSGSTVKPRLGEFVLVDYYVRGITGDGRDGVFLEINDKRLHSHAGISPLLKYGGPRLMQVGNTSKDPAFSTVLQNMAVGDSVQIIARGVKLGGTAYTPRTASLSLREIIPNISRHQTKEIYEYLDTIPKDKTEKIILRHPSTGLLDTLYMISCGGAVDDTLALPDYKVKIDYSGTLINGQPFDVYKNFEVTLQTEEGTALIYGFNQALLRVRRGETIKVIIPYSMGYGLEDQYAGGQITIPAYSPLVFLITMKEFVSR